MYSILKHVLVIRNVFSKTKTLTVHKNVHSINIQLLNIIIIFSFSICCTLFFVHTVQYSILASHNVARIFKNILAGFFAHFVRVKLYNKGLSTGYFQVKICKKNWALWVYKMVFFCRLKQKLPMLLYFITPHSKYIYLFIFWCRPNFSFFLGGGEGNNSLTHTCVLDDFSIVICRQICLLYCFLHHHSCFGGFFAKEEHILYIFHLKMVNIKKTGFFAC